MFSFFYRSFANHDIFKQLSVSLIMKTENLTSDKILNSSDIWRYWKHHRITRKVPPRKIADAGSSLCRFLGFPTLSSYLTCHTYLDIVFS